MTSWTAEYWSEMIINSIIWALVNYRVVKLKGRNEWLWLFLGLISEGITGVILVLLPSKGHLEKFFFPRMSKLADPWTSSLGLAFSW